jgi:hypothetical protein
MLLLPPVTSTLNTSRDLITTATSSKQHNNYQLLLLEC